jgi:hypothetical protein
MGAWLEDMLLGLKILQNGIAQRLLQIKKVSELYQYIQCSDAGRI